MIKLLQWLTRIAGLGALVPGIAFLLAPGFLLGIGAIGLAKMLPAAITRKRASLA